MVGKIILLCLTVCVGRIIDVSLGTLRTLSTVRGKRLVAAGIGFVEAFIWFMVVKDALKDTSAGIWIVFAYSLGYATGVFVGMTLGNLLIKTNVHVQIVTSGKDPEVLKKIREAGYAIIVLNVNGSEFGDDKYMILAEVPGKKKMDFKNLVHSLDEKAFITFQENKSVFNGYFTNVN